MGWETLQSGTPRILNGAPHQLMFTLRAFFFSCRQRWAAPQLAVTSSVNGRNAGALLAFFSRACLSFSVGKISPNQFLWYFPRLQTDQKMSTEICLQPYKYQGQVYSPAFSEPLSPSWSSSSEDEDPDSSPESPMSTSSQKSLKRSNSDGQLCEFRSKIPKYANKYEEMLQPLSPATTLPCQVITNSQQRIAQPKTIDGQLQSQFESVIAQGNEDQISTFLENHSTKININQYNSQGRTALQQSCTDGNLSLAKILVKYGADHRLTTKDGFSTMHTAVFSGHSNLFMYILSLPSHYENR